MTAWLFETFVATTILMLLVLVLRGPVRKAFGPNMAYALWALPVLRLFLPPLPDSWREQAAAPISAAGEAITVLIVDPLTAGDAGATTVAAAASAPSIDWLLLLGLAWAVGAIGFLGYHFVAHTRFCRELLRCARVDRTVAQGRVRVIETDAAHGPLAFGIWTKYVAFPRDFAERYDPVERNLALAHELGHHVRGDLIANWVALVVLALHWFNPVAWKAFRAFRADQEMACDALVLAGRAQALRHAYGRAIVKSAHGGAVSAACHLHTINELKGRLRMLSKTHKFSPARIAAGVAGVGTLSLAALGLTASGTQAAERIKDKVEATIGVDLSQDAPPVPEAPVAPQAAPAAPAAPEAPVAPEAPKKVEKHVYRIVTDGDDKDGKKKIVIVRHGPGGPELADLPDIDAIRVHVPEITSGKCKEKQGEGPDHMVMVDPKDGPGKKRIVICVNRIEAVAANAANTAKLAEVHKKMGLNHAMMGLRMARRSIEAQTDMAPEKKAEALRGIDSAIAELEKEK